MKKNFLLLLPVAIVALACSKNASAPGSNEESVKESNPQLADIAVLLSSVNIGPEQLKEVHDAVCSSSKNGYDEEYTMNSLFESPGSGVGDDILKSEVKSYSKPLRDLIFNYLSNESVKATTKGEGLSPEEYVKYLTEGDAQIYWPNSDEWDGVTMPVISFDPLTDVTSNVGYYMDSFGKIQEIAVNEQLASERPVWIINSNEDAGYETLEMLRQSGGGGEIFVKGDNGTKASNQTVKTLYLKDFTMLRHYDNWFRGASEFFLKIGSVKNFKTLTDDNLYDFTPYVTDFMVVVKRKNLGIPLELNTILVSEWTSELESCGLMLIEDDGGTKTSWKCTATVKAKSKSYGAEIELPYHSRDDIVWRGQLSRKFIEKSADVTGAFGDVRMTFTFKEL